MKLSLTLPFILTLSLSMIPTILTSTPGVYGIYLLYPYVNKVSSGYYLKDLTSTTLNDFNIEAATWARYSSSNITSPMNSTEKVRDCPGGYPLLSSGILHLF